MKVVWTREEDIQHDMYRPYYYDRIAAGLDEQGKPVAWTHRIIGFLDHRARRASPTMRIKNGIDPMRSTARPSCPTAFPTSASSTFAQEPPAIPTASGAASGATHNIFVVESFIDELAAAAKQDPVDYRRALLDKSPRARAVLELAAEQAGWGKPLPPGSGRGIALLARFRQLHRPSRRSVSRRRRATSACSAWSAPSIAARSSTRTRSKAQMESGIIFGLTAALYGEITIKDGRVEQSNFDDYRVLRINEAPPIEVHLVKSAEAPGRHRRAGHVGGNAGGGQRDLRGDRQADSQAADRQRPAQIGVDSIAWFEGPSQQQRSEQVENAKTALSMSELGPARRRAHLGRSLDPSKKYLLSC